MTHRDGRRRILVIEDEPGIRLAVRDELEFEGFDVVLAEDGESGLAAALTQPPDLIVLDVMLPHRNGFQICEAIRARGLHTPIIVITARSQEADRIRGLELGADDYVTKPLSLAELVARVRAVLRRTQAPEPRDVLESRRVRLELKTHRAFRDGLELQLTDTEFRILEVLLRRAGEVVSRDDFLKTVWGDEVYVTHRTVDTHMASLRRKLEQDHARPSYIVSIRNVGYRFNANLAES